MRAASASISLDEGFGADDGHTGVLRPTECPSRGPGQVSRTRGRQSLLVCAGSPFRSQLILAAGEEVGNRHAARAGTARAPRISSATRPGSWQHPFQVGRTCSFRQPSVSSDGAGGSFGRRRVRTSDEVRDGADQARGQRHLGAEVIEHGRQEVGYQGDLRRVLLAFNHRGQWLRGTPRARSTAASIASASGGAGRGRRAGFARGGIAAGDLDEQVVANDAPRRPIGAGGHLIAPAVEGPHDGQAPAVRSRCRGASATSPGRLPPLSPGCQSVELFVGPRPPVEPVEPAYNSVPRVREWRTSSKA